MNTSAIHFTKRVLYFFSSGIALSFLGYIFQIFIGRSLSANEFSIFSALVSSGVLLVSPLNAINLFLTKIIHKNYVEGNNYKNINIYFKIIAVIGFLALIFYTSTFFNVDYIKEFYRINDINIIRIFIGIIALWAIQISINSYLQGFQNFNVYNILNILSVILKIIFCILLIEIGFGLIGAIYGLFLSLLVIVIFGSWIILSASRNLSKIHEWGADKSIISINFLVKLSVASIFYAVITQIDMPLVNAFMTIEQGSTYAAVSSVGKIIIFVPTSLIVFIYSISGNGNEKSYRNFLISISISIVFCFFILLVFYFLGNQILNSTFSRKYQDINNYLFYYGLAFMPYGLISMSEHYALAFGKIIFLKFFIILLPIELFLLYIYHNNIMQILIIIGIFGYLIFVLGLINISNLRVKNLLQSSPDYEK